MGKRFFSIFGLVFAGLVVAFPFIAFAQQEVPNQEFLMYLIQSIGGIKGMGTLALVGLAVQVLIKFMYTPLFGSILKSVSSQMKLLIVSGLTLVGGIVTLMSVEGLSLGAAAVHSSTLLAFSVFANQIYKQFIEKPQV